MQLYLSVHKSLFIFQNQRVNKYSMDHKLNWFIVIFIVIVTAFVIAYTIPDAGWIDCLLIGVGNGAINSFFVFGEKNSEDKKE